MATYPPRHISFTAWKACTGTSARSRLAGGFTAWIDLMRYGQPLAAVFGGPSPEFATRKQRLGHLVEVLTQCGVRPRHGKAGLFSLCQHAGLSVSRPTFSRWVNERPGRDGSLSRDDAEKLFAAVQQAEMDASRRVSGTVAPDGKVLKGRISSTSEGMANWLGDGLLSHAPLLAGNEWFKLYEHLEGLAFAAALMLNLGNNAVTKIILTPSYRLALGIPDAKLKLGDVGALLEAVRPGHDGNLSVVRGYRSLAERLENFRTREGHSSLALAAGYALEASQNHLPTKKGRQTVHSCIVGLARTWV